MLIIALKVYETTCHHVVHYTSSNYIYMYMFWGMFHKIPGKSWKSLA
jgi:hypothetical protein